MGTRNTQLTNDLERIRERIDRLWDENEQKKAYDLIQGYSLDNELFDFGTFMVSYDCSTKDDVLDNVQYQLNLAERELPDCDDADMRSDIQDGIEEGSDFRDDLSRQDAYIYDDDGSNFANVVPRPVRKADFMQAVDDYVDVVIGR